MENFTLAERKTALTSKFQDLSKKEIYEKLIEMGSNLEMLSKDEFELASKVQGCQSQMYVKADFVNDKIYFKIYSDALISAGIGGLFLSLYNGLSPEDILKSDISFLKDLGIIDSLSPGRSNGLVSLYLTMKNIVLPFVKVAIYFNATS